jgi:hypothetical protein
VSGQTTKRTVYFTMVRHPSRGLMRVGNAYGSRKAAADWLPFVRGAWRGCSVSISRCTLVWVGGELTLSSRRVLDQKYNLDAPLAHAADKGGG